jgi:hypothetical protein
VAIAGFLDIITFKTVYFEKITDAVTALLFVSFVGIH